MNTKDGGPAFPSGDNDSKAPYNEGITVRDYFAGQALVGLIAKYGNEGTGAGAICYSLADDLLTERSKP